MSRSRNYCFTLNNWTNEEREAILAWECKYVIIGAEEGEEEETPHLQGYVEWKYAVAVDPKLKALNRRIHWETRMGTAAQAAAYCKKGEQSKAEWEEFKTAGPNYGLNAAFAEAGVISAQGKRSDLDTVADMVIAGAPLAAVAESHGGTFIRYNRGITALRLIMMKERDPNVPPYVEWRWGLAGTGKTRYCVEKHPSHYIKDSSQWFDGYDQQEAIIIDDFDGRYPFRDLLRLLDRYKFSGQVKGGYVPICSPYIYVTCEFPPSHYWAYNDLAQVTRRITNIVEITPGNVLTVVPMLSTEVPAQKLGGNTDPQLA